MAFLSDANEARAVYGTARTAAWITIALTVLTLLYALVIALENWSQIGV